MYEIIYIRADFEPWWMFEGWEEHIKEKYEFKSLSEANAFLYELLQKFGTQYEHRAEKHDAFWAFWTESEKEYCIPCDDNLQIYHGILLTEYGKPYKR